MKITYYLFLAAFSIYLSPLSAQQTPHTLLWRISGKDGHRPSYLYGTMHLMDERLFNLGDSLYEAIGRTDGFAMEVDPNDMMPFLLDEIREEMANSKDLHELLQGQDYGKYAPLLAKKFKKPADKITSNDILREKNKWIRESFRKGKMETFLDVYLFDIARRQNKWTGGIEDMGDQKGMINDAVDQSDIRELLAADSSTNNSQLEQMISVYLRQDLDGIDSITRPGTDRIDPIMRRRNIKMAMRMDSLSGERSMVFAVGAAHLPGKEGLISLLRGKGFNVQPVFSDKKIRAADYKVRPMPVLWNTVKDEYGRYETSMPGKPSNIQLYGILNMKIYFDFFNMIGDLAATVK